MPATKVGIVYSVTTGRARRVIVPDIDSHLSNHHIGVGEEILVVDRQQLSSSTPQDLVTSSTGLTPVDDRYVSVDEDGFPLSAHILDPVCGDDTLSIFTNTTLHKHRVASTGWYLSNGTWHPPVVPKSARFRRKR